MAVATQRSVLLIGGTGFVGGGLLREALRRGWRVAALARAPARVPPGAVLHVGDRRDPAVLRALARGGPYDAVFDLTAFEPEDTQTLLDGLAGALRLLVHLSTVSVYAASQRQEVTEATALRRGEGDGSYGGRKAACERVLESGASAAIVVRAAPLFGPGDPVSREAYFLKRILRGDQIATPCDPGARLSLLHAGDLARALADAAERLQLAGRAYHLAQEERPTLAEHVRAIAAIAGRDAELRSVPAEEWAAAGLPEYAFPFVLRAPGAVFDVSRARRELGFAPRPYAVTVRETVRRLLDEGPERLAGWPGRATTQSRLAGAHEWLVAGAERALGGSAGVSAPLPAGRIPRALSGWEDAGGDALTVAAAPAADPPPAAPAPGARRLALVAGELAEGLPLAPPGAIEAVLEPDRFVADRAWLHHRAAAAAASGYGPENRPPSVALRGFASLDLAAPPAGDDVVLVTWCGAADREALRGWLRRCEAQGAAEASAALGRLWLWAERELLAGDGVLGLDAGTRRWAATFAVCRLLAGVPAVAGGLRLRLADGAAPAAGLVLARAGGAAFACDLAEGRAWPLSPRQAVVLEHLHDAEGALAALVAGGEPPAAAARARERALEQLAAAEVLRGGLAVAAGG